MRRSAGIVQKHDIGFSMSTHYTEGLAVGRMECTNCVRLGARTRGDDYENLREERPVGGDYIR